MKKMSVSRIARIAIVTAVYAGATLGIYPLSFGQIQFRFSEILVYLCFFNPEYCVSLILGCFIANLFSPLTYYDLVFGVMSTIVTVIPITMFGKYKPFGEKTSMLVSGLFATLSMVFVAWELTFFGQPFWLSFGTEALGEFVVVTLLGFPLFSKLGKNKKFIELIKSKNAHF